MFKRTVQPMTPRALFHPARLARRPVLSTQSDERLVDLTRAGSDPAFEAIVERYRRPLMRYVSRILPPERAEDVVQQAFVKAYEAMLRGSAELNLRPWLYRIAHNTALNALRDRALGHAELDERIDGVERPDQAFERSLGLRELVVAVQALPERQRSAILLRELEGRSYEEIATSLGVTDGAVRQLLNRARNTLRAARRRDHPVAAGDPPRDRRLGRPGGRPRGRAGRGRERRDGHEGLRDRAGNGRRRRGRRRRSGRRPGRFRRRPRGRRHRPGGGRLGRRVLRRRRRRRRAGSAGGAAGGAGGDDGPGHGERGERPAAAAARTTTSDDDRSGHGDGDDDSDDSERPRRRVGRQQRARRRRRRRGRQLGSGSGSGTSGHGGSGGSAVSGSDSSGSGSSGSGSGGEGGGGSGTAAAAAARS